MNKIITAIIVATVVILGGYFLLKNPANMTPAAKAPDAKETPLAVQNIVTYADLGYSPNILRVKVGAAVTFKNNSSRAMWTASASHPTHTVYPTTGGCLGSTFDACKGVQPGGSWSFKFDIAGNWKYHDHLNPGNTGTIIVE